MSQTDTTWGARRTRQIGWHEPVAPPPGLTGLELMHGILAGRLPPPPIAELFGSRLIAVGDGEATFGCTPDESVYNPLGMVHGGWLCMLLDSAAGCAVHTRLPAGVGYASIEIKVSFLKPVRGEAGEVTVSGRVLRVGRSVAFAEAHARSAAGELVGHATSSLAIVRA